MTSYLWIKAFHLIAMVAWFAGLFYIFRLFVYHVKHKDNPQMAAAYSVMERKLLYMIMHPAMLLTLLFGVWLVTLNPDVLRSGWIQAKFFFVMVLVAYQIFCGITHKQFARGEYFLSEKACRIINEVPTLCLIIIIILAVVKPV
jgi:putative membrane protein